MSPSPLRLLIFVLAIAFVIGIIQVGLVSIAFDKLNLSPQSAFLLLMATVAGSLINLPLFRIKADPDAPRPPPLPPQLAPFFKMPPFTGKILITVNVGGALVPVAFSLYLMGHTALSPVRTAATIMAVAFIAEKLSRPIPGIGIGMPMLVAPIAAAVFASLLDPEHRAPLAYISGTLGVLIGADFLRLKDLRKLGATFASIGGAGTLDGVFLTGIIAVLLA